jgi:hypothetical protein
MKTLGRILIILAVFALAMGVTYVIVNAGSSSSSGALPAFGQGNGRFAPQDGASGFADGTQPNFTGRERNESDGERGGSGWLLGAIRNILVIGMIVAIIVLPKSWMEKRKRSAQVTA